MLCSPPSSLFFLSLFSHVLNLHRKVQRSVDVNVVCWNLFFYLSSVAEVCSLVVASQLQQGGFKKNTQVNMHVGEVV